MTRPLENAMKTFLVGIRITNINFDGNYNNSGDTLSKLSGGCVFAATGKRFVFVNQIGTLLFSCCCFLVLKPSESFQSDRNVMWERWQVLSSFSKEIYFMLTLH